MQIETKIAKKLLQAIVKVILANHIIFITYAK